MSWLATALLNLSRPLPRATNLPYPGQRKDRVNEAKIVITTEFLNLIEQAKEQSLPLHWLANEVKKL